MRGKVHFVESGGSPTVLKNVCLNMVLTGNPGTGKTTLAPSSSNFYELMIFSRKIASLK
jgi:replication-associated recombination protein RarA